MATAWQGLGSQVTLLACTPRLLPRMEPFVGEFVARGLSDAGVDVRVGVNITELQRSADSGAVDVTLDCGDHVVVDEILFATGRTPNTKDVGVETVGLTPGAWLDVDDSCLVRGVDETWLYALGDVNHRALLTHQGKYQARVAANVISARARGDFVDTAPWGAYVTTADSKAVPQAFFTDPEAGSVGLTADTAGQLGFRIKTVDVNIGDVVTGGNLYADGYTGQARLVIDLDDGILLGASFVGPGVSYLQRGWDNAVNCLRALQLRLFPGLRHE
jgi:pyruvate/2-oxoglutarate dehydrogenase complex dihydrolipoamide dehydrogenase (E3) component